MTLPQDLDRKHSAMLKRLESASGSRFDGLYASMQLKGHQDAVKLFQSYAQNGDDAQLKQWAKDTLPKLQEHLHGAATLQSVGRPQAQR